MSERYMTADELYIRTMEHVAPLPCQEAYARNLAELFSYHMKKNYLMDNGFSAEYLPYQSAIVVAPSGQGKSFLMREMAKICKTNVILIDGSSLCHEGWKGVSLSQRLLAAKNAAKDDSTFERSIIVIDEADKLRHWGTQYDQSAAQENLLQLFGGDPIVAEGSNNREAVSLDSSRWTIILAGAFSGLDDIIRSRLNCKSSMGFSVANNEKEITTAEVMQKVIPQDLVKYGMMTELIGRIGSIICIKPMELEDYRQLLTANSGSICKRYINYFASLYGVDFAMTEDSVQTIANSCMNSTTGARAIHPLINDLMREAMSSVDRDSNINKVILDALDGKCCVRYERGSRKYSALDPDAVEVLDYAASELSSNFTEPYMLKASSVSAMTNKIISIYDETDGDQNCRGELYTFLNCCIYYLKHNTNPEDFCFDSLFKLAKTVQKSSFNEDSTFDIMMKDGIKVDTKRGLLAGYYESFVSRFTLHTSTKLVTAMNKISRRLLEEYNSSDVRFEISRSN